MVQGNFAGDRRHSIPFAKTTQSYLVSLKVGAVRRGGSLGAKRRITLGDRHVAGVEL